MQLLVIKGGDKSNSGAHLVLIFGLGLIGTTISHALRRSCETTALQLPYDWTDTNLRNQHSQLIIGHVEAALAANRGRVDVVWAAGKAGFSAGESELSGEWLAFSDVLVICRKLDRKHGGVNVIIHFISSAGGLYEGQTFVDVLAEPTPRRPYGVAKAQQEAALGALRDIRHFIYRPSTVYGYAPGGRAGIVATLIGNAMQNRVTRVFGSPNTLRDYLYAEDIGCFVRDRILGNDIASNTFLLASAKPSSMIEIIKIVRDAIRMPLYLRFDPVPSNALDNSFRASALPKDFSPTSIAVGIRRTAFLMQEGDKTWSL